ncbi:MAG TPA: hypothetical protein VFZ97_09060 [Acidimicrobiales bacterium]
MGRRPAAARVIFIAAALVLAAGIVSVSIPGMITGTERAGPRVAAPASPTTTAVTATTTTTVAAPPSTLATVHPSPSAAPALVPISRSTALARTGTHTGNLLAGGVALVMLGGVLVLAQRPEPYAPRHLRRRRARSR